MLLLVFVLGVFVGVLVGAWCMWRDLYWRYKDFFDKVREKERWRRS